MFFGRFLTHFWYARWWYSVFIVVFKEYIAQIHNDIVPISTTHSTHRRAAYTHTHTHSSGRAHTRTCTCQSKWAVWASMSAAESNPSVSFVHTVNQLPVCGAHEHIRKCVRADGHRSYSILCQAHAHSGRPRRKRYFIWCMSGEQERTHNNSCTTAA